MYRIGDVKNLVLPQPTHVGYVTRDLERTIHDFERCFGLHSFKIMVPEYYNRRYYQEREDFEVRLAFSRVGNMVYEVIEVIKGRTIYHDFLREHGEGIHHLGYEISNLAEWIQAYRSIDIEPIMSAERIGLKWAYFNTPGIIVELLERGPQGVVV